MNNYCLVYTKKVYNRDTGQVEEQEVTVVPAPNWMKANNYNINKLAQKLGIKNYKIVNKAKNTP